MEGNQPRRSFRFADSVNPSSDVELTHKVKEPATVEDLDVRIYRGAELDLHVKPQVKRDGRRFDLVEYNGKSYVDGDGDHWTFDVSEQVSEGDLLVVQASNVDPDYSLDFAVDMIIDREGGTSRLIPSIFGRLA